MKIRSLVLAGPTGSGKTDISLSIAADFLPDIFEIISADSVQIYRHLNIGSGKIPLVERRGIIHHQIDIVDPDEPYSAGDYRDDSYRLVSDVLSRGKIPFFVGGTGLYLDAFFEGLSEAPETDPEIREMLSERGINEGWEILHAELSRVDPESAQKIHPNDSQRIIRALAVFLKTGTTLSFFRGKKRSLLNEDILFLAPDIDRDRLYERIDRRVDAMIADGFYDEVRTLRGMGYSRELNSMNTIGYAQLNAALDGELSLDDAIERIKHDTRKYAKKQLIWFRRKSYINLFKPDDLQALIPIIKRWYEHQE